ncbi:probable receptor-like protein kinase At1g80640 isoform X2 [Hevea brasiliensis]|uniref:probable receptor-like protein kinase At1g80640 isoform X2 n=1 Tax=Hevea brasiliensis TaxID=3981 RepID=UPI000B776B58|nr:probable receptor-like protein kinase At1g80640 isoform X2 [Hevea brasiliensis]
MNLLALFLPMWALSSTFLFFLLDARPESTFSTNSRPALLAKKEPISFFSAKMETQSPGLPMAPMDKVVHHQDLNKRILIALVVASSLLGAILVFLSCFCIHRMKNSKNSSLKGKQNFAGNGHSLSPVLGKLNSLTMVGNKDSIAVMEYELLEAATNNFQENNLLGEGGHGRVYKARVNEKLLAAVKKLEGVGRNVQREFENEMNWLTKIQHQNIISLLGYCIHDEAKFLVYEIMQNGSLESQLHGPTHGSALTWLLRMKIAVDVARGLEYLHEHCNPPVVHRDIKSSNILLDSNFNAKLSDFGLAVNSGIKAKSVKLSGTLGYVAPEYLLHGKLTDKSDVYAFGVVLLELLMGRKPVEMISEDQCLSIVTWAMPQLTDRSKLPNIVDPVIKDTMDLRHLYQVAAVAVLCVQQEPSYRPLITDVLHSLIPLVPLELGGSLRITEPLPSA